MPIMTYPGDGDEEEATESFGRSEGRASVTKSNGVLVTEDPFSVLTTTWNSYEVSGRRPRTSIVVTFPLKENGGVVRRDPDASRYSTQAIEAPVA
jgi:hypothetical protein